MIPEIIKKWEEKKLLLRHYFENTNQSEYDEYIKIVRILVEKVINDGECDYLIDKITEVDDGDYQGTKIFLIPRDTYQPGIEDYIITHNYYGSCSGCDTLLGISGYENGKPNEEQVNEYMTLCLHLVQKMQKLNKDW
jgi:hypothetical protein